MVSALLAWLIAYLIGGEFYSVFLVGAVGGAVVAVLKVLRSLFPKQKRTRSRKVKRQRKVARSSAPVRPAAQLAKAATVVERKPSLLERWREESRRMAEANEVFCEVDDEDEEAEEPEEIDVCEVIDACEAVRDEESEADEAFYTKELARLNKVLSGLYLKRDKMLYVYGINDETQSASASAREIALAKMTKTKAWRGLQFDIDYVLRNIEYLERAN